MSNQGTVRLGDVCIKGSSNIKQSDLVNNNGDYPIYGASGFIKNVDFYTQDKPYIGVVKDGAGVGRVMKLPALSSVIGTMQYIIPNDDIDVSYLAYAMEHMNLSKYYMGAAIPHIYFKDYKNEKLPNHTSNEQAQIVHVLDLICNQITKRNEQLSKLDELIKSRFAEMFGDPIINPHNWSKVPLEELAEIKIGPFGSLLHKEDYTNNGHALVNPSHIKEDKIIVDNSLTVSDEKYAELSAYHLHKNDVVLGRRGEMGRCAVVNDGGLLCGTGSIIIRTNGVLESDYIQKIISFPSFKKSIEDMAVGQTMPNLNVPIVSKFLIICPPMDVQKKYYSFVEQIDKSKLVVKKQIEKLETLKKSLMQEYFG